MRRDDGGEDGDGQSTSRRAADVDDRAEDDSKKAAGPGCTVTWLSVSWDVAGSAAGAVCRVAAMKSAAADAVITACFFCEVF